MANASRKLMSPDSLHPSPGFSHIALAQGATVVFLAGQTALDRDFSIVGGGDLAAQTRRAMQNVGIALAAVEADWGDMVRRTIYTTRPTEFEIIAAAIDEVTGGGPQPAQTIVGVTGLALPGLLIEIEVTAVLA
jgi:enamine deaminase RidA (YjgF/YER057c/UK114 family)